MIGMEYIGQKLFQQSTYYDLFNRHDRPILVIDADSGRILEINDIAVEYYGYSFDKLLSMKIQNISIQCEEDVRRHMSLVEREGRMRFKSVHRLANGEQRDVEVNSLFLKVEGSRVLFSMIEDISSRKFNERDLLLFKKALEVNSEGVVLTDDNGNALWINNAFTEITGYSIDDIFGKNASILKSGVQDQEFYESMWHKLVYEGKWSGEIWNKNKNGSIYSEWLSINKIQLDKTIYYVGIFKDLSEKKKIDRRMDELQRKDSLTGLYNRNYFIELIDTYIRRCREGNNRLSIIFVDVNGFKGINNSLGHLVGDDLLVEFSKRLVRLTDIHHFLCRFNEDKFGIIYRNFSSKGDIGLFSRNILKAIGKPFKIGNTVLHIGANIGISLFPDDGQDAETLVRYADIALNRAKGLVEDRICFYSKEMSSEIEEKFLLANYLIESIPNRELSICYQPIFSIEQENRILGAEALLRWSSPILGEISPEVFIPLAEKTGQIIEIGEWVLKEVCKQIRLWQDKGYNTVPVGVNVSVKQLEQVGFAKKVLEIMKKNAIDGNSLELEITESVSLGDLAVIIGNIRELKRAGIKISMDDFGTGFSSLGQLDLFELDKLKIDKIFIDDIVRISKRQNLVKSIIAMAESLDLVTVAEGIETHEQLECLKELGCKLGQGYLFSKPLEKTDVEEFIEYGNYILG